MLCGGGGMWAMGWGGSKCSVQTPAWLTQRLGSSSAQKQRNYSVCVWGGAHGTASFPRVYCDTLSLPDHPLWDKETEEMKAAHSLTAVY